jgi:hypothetical protein
MPWVTRKHLERQTCDKESYSPWPEFTYSNLHGREALLWHRRQTSFWICVVLPLRQRLASITSKQLICYFDMNCVRIDCVHRWDTADQAECRVMRTSCRRKRKSRRTCSFVRCRNMINTIAAPSLISYSRCAQSCGHPLSGKKGRSVPVVNHNGTHQTWGLTGAAITLSKAGTSISMAIACGSST